MSKAFTRDDALPDPPLSRAAPRLEPGERRYITAEGMTALREEAAALEAGSPRAQLLHATIAMLTVADPPEDGRALFGSHVTLEDEQGALREYRLVGPDEADARRGFVSVNAPLARALLGKREGEAVAVELPRGTVEYRIVRARSHAP